MSQTATRKRTRSQWRMRANLSEGMRLHSARAYVPPPKRLAVVGRAYCDPADGRCDSSCEVHGSF